MPTAPATEHDPTTPVAAGAAAPALWQRELSVAIRDAAELCAALGLPPEAAAEIRAAATGFPLLVPRPFLARMRRGDPRDPLLLQVLPTAAERQVADGFSTDPIGELAARTAPGLIHKYAGRALVLATGGCAVHCRYCFRREFPYADSGATLAGVAAAVETVAADPTIEEVILSGGDPLLVDDDRLARLVGRIEAIPHVRRLRIHSRLPVVLPSRVNDGLCDLLSGSRLAVVVVIHANHPTELDEAVAAAVRRLATARAILLNQAVLLAGINDDAATLRGLSQRLVEIGVVPYYLHLLDRVQGAAHFDVDADTARRLHAVLRDSLPGYAVPRLVRDEPGQPAKSWIA